VALLGVIEQEIDFLELRERAGARVACGGWLAGLGCSLRFTAGSRFRRARAVTRGVLKE
jgi:hypothetical protein